MTLACAVPLTTGAQTTAPEPAAAEQGQQATQPPRPRVQVHDGDGREMRPPREYGGGGGGPGGPGGPPGPPMAGMAGPERPAPIDAPTAEEWDRSEAFLKEHAPKRWAILQNLDEEGQQRVRGFVFWRFRTLERMKNNDPDMYQLHLKRFGIEDEIFGIRFPIRQEGRFATEEEMSKMRERVAALVDVSLEEREIRVQRLREMLKREEDYLAAERGSRDAAIQERVSLIEQGRSMGMGRGFGGPGGGYAPAGPPPDRQPPPAAR